MEGGFALQPHEADWLAERILLTQGDTLLGDLVARPVSAYRDADYPWEADRGSDLHEVEHARQFSLAAKCLTRLYALQVAEDDKNRRLTRPEYQVPKHSTPQAAIDRLFP